MAEKKPQSRYSAHRGVDDLIGQMRRSHWQGAPPPACGNWAPGWMVGDEMDDAVRCQLPANHAGWHRYELEWESGVPGKCPECGAVLGGASYDHDPTCSQFPVRPTDLREMLVREHNVVLDLTEALERVVRELEMYTPANPDVACEIALTALGRGCNACWGVQCDECPFDAGGYQRAIGRAKVTG